MVKKTIPHRVYFDEEFEFGTITDKYLSFKQMICFARLHFHSTNILKFIKGHCPLYRLQSLELSLEVLFSQQSLCMITKSS